MRMNRALRRRVWRGGLTLVVTALFLAPPAAAADVYVDCRPGNPSGSPFTSITEAINSLSGSPPPSDYDYILLKSDCTENVAITAVRRLYIAPEWDWCPWSWCTTNGPLARITAADANQPVLSVGGPENVTLVHLSLSGGSTGLQVNGDVTALGVVAENNAPYVMGVSGDGITAGLGAKLGMGEGGSLHNAGYGIRLSGGAIVDLYGRASWLQNKPLAVSGNGKGGILSDRAHLSSWMGTVIENNEGWGLVTAGGDTTWGAGNDTESVIQGNEGGAFLYQGSSAGFWGSTTFRDNGAFGVWAEGASYVILFAGETSPNVVEGHAVVGVNVTMNSQGSFRGPNRIRNNGSAGEPASAGVRVDGNSNAFFHTGAEVRGNLGPGILVDLNASLDAPAAVVRGNAKEGVRVRHMSVAYLGPDSSIRPNGNGPLTCDSTSMAVTDLVQRSPACVNVEKPSEPRLPWPPDPYR